MKWGLENGVHLVGCKEEGLVWFPAPHGVAVVTHNHNPSTRESEKNGWKFKVIFSHMEQPKLDDYKAPSPKKWLDLKRWKPVGSYILWVPGEQFRREFVMLSILRAIRTLQCLLVKEKLTQVLLIGISEREIERDQGNSAVNCTSVTQCSSFPWF